MALTEQQAEAIVDEWDGDAEISVREDYSGRGMYGSTCVGFVIPNPGFAIQIGFIAAELNARFEDNEDWTPIEAWDLPSRVDNMGLDYILY